MFLSKNRHYICAASLPSDHETFLQVAGTFHGRVECLLQVAGTFHGRMEGLLQVAGTFHGRMEGLLHKCNGVSVDKDTLLQVGGGILSMDKYQLSINTKDFF